MSGGGSSTEMLGGLPCCVPQIGHVVISACPVSTGVTVVCSH